MNIYTISQESLEKTNKALSESLGVEYSPLTGGDQNFQYIRKGWGGKTKGTTGYKFTNEQKANMSAAQKGKQSWLGKQHTEKTKKKISQSKTGSKLSEETKKKMSITRQNKGFKHTEETKQKMREIGLKREQLKRQALGN